MIIDYTFIASVVLMNLSIILLLYRMYKLEKRQNKQDLQVENLRFLILNFIYGPALDETEENEHTKKETD
jgi:hypothetical protein